MYDKIEEYYKEVYRDKVKLITRILKGDKAGAEDVVQEAFCRALKFCDSYDRMRGTIDKWFNSIMFNFLREHQRMMHNRPTGKSKDISAEEVFKELHLQSNSASRELIISHIHKVVNESHRRVLKLFFVNGYTSTEISQVESDMTVNNVTTIVSRFRKAILEEQRK